MDQPTDILIVGGGTTTLLFGAGQKVRQLPLSFAGLGEAYQLIPECATVVILPDPQITMSMPTVHDLERFNEPNIGNFITTTLGFDTPPDTRSSHEHIQKILSTITTSEETDFARGVAQAGFRCILARVFTVVNAGCTVYMLMPEDYPDWPDANREVLNDAMPGICISRAVNETWSARIDGEYAWLLENTRSQLVFGLGTEYSQRVDCGAELTALDPLTDPDQVLKILPHDLSVTLERGAWNRVGRCHACVFRWGKGRLILGSAASLGNVLDRLEVAAQSRTSTSLERCREAKRQIEARLAAIGGINPFVGESDAIVRLYPDILRAVENHRHNVLIYGEVGAGKEVLVELLTLLGKRDAPVVKAEAMTIAGGDPKVVSSQLFGVEPGTFHGVEGRVGLITLADAGTFVLDGMEGAPVELQRLLRRVLEPETRTYRAEGSEKESTAQCRFIGLFNVDPSSLIRQQKLLPDFLERFSIKLHIPPLRERKDDIPRLARHLASRHMASMGVTTHADQCMPSDAVIDEWCARDWQNESGNVRGLRTAVIEYVEGKLHELSVHPHTEHVLLHQEPKRGRPCLMDDTQLGMILRNAAHNGLCWADLKANLTTSHGKPICQSVRALKQRMRRNQVEVTPEVKRYLHGLRVDEGAR